MVETDADKRDNSFNGYCLKQTLSQNIAPKDTKLLRFSGSGLGQVKGSRPACKYQANSGKSV